jgi:hypothetical protein
MNLFRLDKPKDKPGQVASGWSPPMVGDFHALARFGELGFGDDKGMLPAAAAAGAAPAASGTGAAVTPASSPAATPASTPASADGGATPAPTGGARPPAGKAAQARGISPATAKLLKAKMRERLLKPGDKPTQADPAASTPAAPQ